MNPLLFSHPHLTSQAQELAERFGFILSTEKDIHKNIRSAYEKIPILNLTPNGLMVHPHNMKPWTIDFLSGEKQYRRTHGGREILARACGIKKNQEPLTILDLTAGLAKDAFILACLGANVILVERDPIIAALLEDALKRFYAEPEYSKNIHLTLFFDEAENFLRNHLQTAQIPIFSMPDIIYIDPMHPQRQKSAHVKKEMQILQQWIPPENNPEHLLNLSLQYAQKRVVLKWPRKAAPLNHSKPSFIYEESTVRFEVYTSSHL